MPSRGTAVESESFTVVPGSNNLAFPIPDQAHERQQLGVDADDSTRRLFRAGRVDDSDGTVVSSEGKSIAARGESNRMDPPSRAVEVLAADSVEGQALTPYTRVGTGVGSLDEAGEDPGMGVGGSGSEKDGVGMPAHGSDGTPNGLLQVLRDPPVVLLFEVANGDDPVTGADSELGLGRGPTNKGSRSGDSEKNQRRLIASGRRLPDQGVTVLGTGDDAAGAGSDVDTGDGLVVTLELVLQLEGRTNSSIEFDRRILGNGESVAIGREGVVGNGAVEELVNFGSSHRGLMVVGGRR